ncbi:spermatogenesis-associated protein 33 [Balaenoptera ricei]|uniref:spermatogenesis-associated protein 33 n=1 Tax=Balaenoptera ricei TaxID=2746895 RepID=UPI0028BD9E0F|nr:spermatogenesis-associated protein 33 [Balaenoptera ricei]
MGLAKSKHKLRKGGEPKSGRTYSIPKATERPVDRPSQESEKPADTKPAESFREKKGAAKRQWPSPEVERRTHPGGDRTCLTPSCKHWSGGSDLWAGQPGRAHRDAGRAGSHRAGKRSAAGEATGEPQPAALISQPVQPRQHLTAAPGKPQVVTAGRTFPEFLSHKTKPDVNSEKKKFAIPQIVVTTASKETLISYGSTGMEEQRTIRERAEPGPFYRHRNPSTVDAYNSQTKE